MFRLLVPLMLSTVLYLPAYAEELRFETTSEGIIEALTQPELKGQRRTRGLTRSLAAKTRSIKVVRKQHGKMLEENVTVAVGPPAQGVNLKIEFDYNSYAIRSSSFGLLSEVGKALTSNEITGEELVIIGHSDSDGSDAYNLRLSLFRAESVKMYLVENFNIEPMRLSLVGYGEAMPVVPNSSPANKQLNRRVEIRVVF